MMGGLSDAHMLLARQDLFRRIRGWSNQCREGAVGRTAATFSGRAVPTSLQKV